MWDSIAADLRITAPQASPLAPAAGRAAEIFPWFIHNALVHYLSPRGLEQYSGGGWGTRDVCQGPVELLLALGRFEPMRDLLCRVFRQQNPDGDWPQWFMFFDRERNIRPGRFPRRHRLLAAARPRPISLRHRRRRLCWMKPCRSSIRTAMPRRKRPPSGSTSSARWT